MGFENKPETGGINSDAAKLEGIEGVLEQIAEEEARLSEGLAELRENFAEAEAISDASEVESSDDVESGESGSAFDRISEICNKAQERLMALRSSVLAGTVTGTLLTSDSAFAATEGGMTALQTADAMRVVGYGSAIAIGLTVLAIKGFVQKKDARKSKYTGRRNIR